MAEQAKKKASEKKTVYRYIKDHEGDKAPFKEFWKNIRMSDYDLDEIDSEDKKTALQLCLEFDIKDKAWVLLEFFADPNIISGEGKSALDYALEGNKKVFQFLLLLFGAKLHMHDPEKKNEAPVDSEGKKDDKDEKEIDAERFDKLDGYKKTVDSLKDTFIFLTRKRRKYLRYIFQRMAGNEGDAVDENGLTNYYRELYPMDSNKAEADAHKFMEICGNQKINDDEDKSAICFEDFLLAMLKITKVKGIEKLDEFINVFLKKYREDKRILKDEANRDLKKNKEAGS